MGEAPKIYCAYELLICRVRQKTENGGLRAFSPDPPLHDRKAGPRAVNCSLFLSFVDAPPYPIEALLSKGQILECMRKSEARSFRGQHA